MLDGEDPNADRDEVAAHVASCGTCADWRDAAHEVTRRARLQLADAAPDRASEVIAAVRARTRLPRRPYGVTAARAALWVLAAAQLALTVPFLLFGHDHSAPAHVAHEMGALDAALAAGFGVAAWRPGRALGMRAILGVAALLLVVTAATDVAMGRTSLADEAPHLLPVAGWLLVCYLSWAAPPARETRPLAGRLLSRPLRVPGGSLYSAAVTAPPGLASRMISGLVSEPMPGEQAHRDEAPAACGCRSARCSCPGCAGRAAAG